jgi:hypothetical protein
MAQKGEARILEFPIISPGSTAYSTERIEMKLRLLKASYALALLVAFVVAAGAGSKFHGNG